MSSTQTTDRRHRVAVVEADVIAWASYRIAADEIASHRKAPGGTIVSPSLLRHADEQTVVGLAAVFQAIKKAGLDPESFGGWSVLAAPRYFGRMAFERAFPQFQAEGAWGISPHLIPAHSLHSPSGTISQAIKAHGPNLGVGGTPGGEQEAMLFAATLLGMGLTSGVWLVITGRANERDGVEAPGDYEALALALTAPSPGFVGHRLRIKPDEIHLFGQADASTAPGLGAWFGPGTLRVDQAEASSAIPRPHFAPLARRPSNDR